MSKTITYVYLGNRQEKLSNYENQDIPKEFFYGYQNFIEDNYKVDILEFGETSKESILYKNFWQRLDRLLRKATKLPFFSRYIMQREKKLKILSSNNLVLVGDRVAVSLLPVLIYIKLFKRSVITSTFVLGLFSNKSQYSIVNFLQSIFMYLLLASCSNFLFLGEGEYNFATKKHPKWKSKFHFTPFCIDSNFWADEDSYSANKRNGILFIGNDGKRDYEKAIKIANKLPEYDFTFITKRIDKKRSLNENIKLNGGTWARTLISDNQLKEIYKNAKLTIVPLFNSLQPSGQSVSLQSMASGTPVIITKTEGFWDTDNFIDNENIILQKNNSLDEWVQTIRTLYDDKDRLQNLSTNGKALIINKFNSDIFYKSIKNIILGEKTE